MSMSHLEGKQTNQANDAHERKSIQIQTRT